MLMTFSKGLGQLEAYIDVEEGVAFQMDNGLFWDSLGSGSQWAIEGMPEKKKSSKFWVTRLLSGKVLLRNWIGMFLAPVDAGTDPQTFLIQPVQYSKDDSLKFDVFFRGNKVAFRAYNGLFLARSYQDFHALEAAKFFADESCCFRPLIGDISLPTFEALAIIPTDLSRVRYHQDFLKKQFYINRSEEPVRHKFNVTWETYCSDKIAWNRPWGLGLTSSFSFTVEEAKPILQYTKDNALALALTRHVFEKVTGEVEVPPNTEATAHLWIEKHNNASIPFTAIIRKVKPDGREVIMKEAGAWKGLAYRELQLQITMKSLCSHHEACAIM